MTHSMEHGTQTFLFDTSGTTHTITFTRQRICLVRLTRAHKRRGPRHHDQLAPPPSPKNGLSSSQKLQKWVVKFAGTSVIGEHTTQCWHPGWTKRFGPGDIFNSGWYCTEDHIPSGCFRYSCTCLTRFTLCVSSVTQSARWGATHDSTEHLVRAFVQGTLCALSWRDMDKW